MQPTEPGLLGDESGHGTVRGGGYGIASNWSEHLHRCMVVELGGGGRAKAFHPHESSFLCREIGAGELAFVGSHEGGMADVEL